MNVTIRQLRAVVSLSATGSFRRSAEQTHVSSPALSIAIAQLERDLGVTLFDRTSRQVRVSEVGQRFVENARRVLADYDHMLLDIGDVAAARRGVVTIASVASVAARVLPAALQKISALFPGIEVRLVDDVGSKVIVAVKERVADFALVTTPEADDGDIVAETLHQDPFYLAFHSSHRLNAKKTATWSDMAGERLIGLNDSTASAGIVGAELHRQSVQCASTFTVSHLSVAHGMLDANFGVCALPEIALPARRHPDVVARLLTKPRAWRPIAVCRLRARALSPAAEAALGVIRDTFRAQSWKRER